MVKRKKQSQVILLFLVSSLAVVCLTGCSSFGRKLKSFLGGSDSSKKTTQAISSIPKNRRTIKFSENPNVKFNSRRQYRRMTKNRFEKEAQIEDSAGSLWVSEGQSAYWFAENKMRMVGDLLNVKLIGAAKEQLETKVKVIKRLLRKLDAPPPSPFRRLASKKKSKKDKKSKDEKEGEEKEGEAKEEPPAPVVQRGPQKDVDGTLPVEQVPTRIIQKTMDGNYRVQGSQAFMIGKREYRVIVTGIVRAEDFNDEGIESAKVLDPKYDIVSDRRSLVR